MRERFSRWICRHLHRGITRPVNGEYICLRCQRVYQVAWNTPQSHGNVPRIARKRSLEPELARNSDTATGLPEAKAGHFEFVESRNGWQWVDGEVAELERLLPLDRPTGVE